jgi:hypothetical protein
MRMRQLRFGAVCVAAIAMVASLPAHAQEYPTKPVTFITPAAAGNSPDVATRVVADRLTQIWKQQIVVLNRPGAGGLIAAQAAAAVEKDGYSLYVAQASTFTVLPIEQEGKLPVNLQTAFAPIGMVGEQPIALSVNKDVPAGNVAELIALANKTPDGMLFGATNRGGQSHLTGELFRERAKANISFVHAAGASVSLNDVIALFELNREITKLGRKKSAAIFPLRQCQTGNLSEIVDLPVDVRRLKCRMANPLDVDHGALRAFDRIAMSRRLGGDAFRRLQCSFRLRLPRRRASASGSPASRSATTGALRCE